MNYFSETTPKTRTEIFAKNLEYKPTLRIDRCGNVVLDVQNGNWSFSITDDATLKPLVDRGIEIISFIYTPDKNEFLDTLEISFKIKGGENGQMVIAGYWGAMQRWASL